MADKTVQELAHDKTIFRDKDNGRSMARAIAFLGAVGGLVALIGGLVIAIIVASSGNKDLLDVAKEGKEIAVAGLGVFTAGGLTKVASGISETIASKKKRT